MKKLLTALPVLLLVLSSCQKEISFETLAPGAGTGGSSNGDLLVKAYEITVQSKDTNTVTFQWDNSKRLLQYYSLGVVNGFKTYVNHRINRAADGKIIDIISRTELGGVLSDSSVYSMYYLPNSAKLSYTLAKHITPVMDLFDSSAYTYNSAGQISSKQLFSDLLGGWEPLSKEDYSYDANGNLTKISASISDFNGGWISGATTSYTYGAHKAPMTLSEESYSVIGPIAVSKNNVTKAITNAVASGSTYTGTYVQQKFNSYDRASEEVLSVSPQPPGYDIRIVYYYQ